MKGIYIVYEWAIYTDCTKIQEDDGSTSIDYDGDCQFHDTYAGIADIGNPDEINVIELQRSHRSVEDGDLIERYYDRSVEDGDLIERYYAVMEDGKLPEFFDGTQIKIPKRFHDELNNYREKAS